MIAGETGSGQSTQMRSVLTTLIKALPPDRMELYLCDLKRSEFHLFRQAEHVRGLFASPVRDAADAKASTKRNAISW
ncbi:FtsK/SpoIIIE domain-containing protein [Mesobacillus zeae]|uniref:FtsK/SpoIIIE domain-containing protein n=1 Tax=Mesobacillus zeae TaxID=1917180 RepID=UPI003AB68E34